MTNHWDDLKNAKVFLIEGSNVAENHVMAMKWIRQAQSNGAKVIHVDPRYNRTSAIADIFACIRPGADIAFLGAIIRLVIERGWYDAEYVKLHTNGLMLLSDDFGFEDGAYRLDPTVHPFATSFARTDIRMTTRYKPTNLRALWAAMHEAGHGLTYQGVDPALGRSPLYGNASLGLGESQSRSWENLVGRSLPFRRGRYPELQRLFPQLERVDLETWYRGINRVAPGLIRVDADEVTYSLHIILRFELEQQLVAGELALADLPEAWNARMRELLGVEVPDDARGVLQDVHWTRASYGYFPTYALGNALSVQIWRVVEQELPDLDAQLEAGEFGPLYESLRGRLYRHGRKFTPMQTLERAIGADAIDPQPYLEYLRGKVKSLRA